MDKINLIIPAKEEISNLFFIIKPLLKRNEINKIILVLHKKNNKKFINNRKLKIIIPRIFNFYRGIKMFFKKNSQDVIYFIIFILLIVQILFI